MSNPMRALLVTTDPWLTANFTEIAREVGVDAQPTSDTAGDSQELIRAKYEAALLDFDTTPDALAILVAVRQHPSNRNAVVLAVATDGAQGQKALENGANLLLERPLDPKQIRRGLYAVYDLMVQERRRYFRCAVELPVLVIQTSSGGDFKCISMNISGSGIALKTPSTLEPGEKVEIIVSLPGSALPVRAIGTVVWDDKHGKTGISFKCTSPDHQAHLDSWLDAQLISPRQPRVGISN